VVDGAASNAADGNAGTAAAPLRTIGEAVRRIEQANAQGEPVKVRVHPHTYRETVLLQGGRQATGAAVTIEATGPGVIVSSSEVFTSWRRVGDLLVHDWNERWGVAPIPSGWEGSLDDPKVSPLLRRRELVFADGAPLRQAGTETELTAARGRFLVDEAAGTITVNPPAGTTNPTLEVGVRPTAMHINGWSNVTVRGLAFQHAPSAIQQSAVFLSSVRNVTLDDIDVRWNSWSGLGVATSADVVVRDSRLDDNGILGLLAYQPDRMLMERNSTSRNNWRGAWTGFDNWENTAKVWAARGFTLREHTAVDNHSYGFWFDWDNVDVVVERSYFARNSRAGLFIEASQGPFQIEGNVICDNQIVGLEDGRSENVTVVDNRIMGNGDAQIRFTGHAGGRRIKDRVGTSMLLETRNWRIEGNVLAGSTSTQSLFRTTLPRADWTKILASLRSDANTWHQPSNARPFRLPDGVTTDLPGWRTATNQDAASTTTATAASLQCAAPFGTAAPAPSPTPTTAPAPSPNPGTTDIFKPRVIERSE
jgi:hypothetical protein